MRTIMLMIIVLVMLFSCSYTEADSLYRFGENTKVYFKRYAEGLTWVQSSWKGNQEEIGTYVQVWNMGSVTQYLPAYPEDSDNEFSEYYLVETDVLDPVDGNRGKFNYFYIDEAGIAWWIVDNNDPYHHEGDVWADFDGTTWKGVLGENGGTNPTYTPVPTITETVFITQTATASFTPTYTPTTTMTFNPTITSTPTPTPVITNTSWDYPTSTFTLTPTPTATATATKTMNYILANAEDTVDYYKGETTKRLQVVVIIKEIDGPIDGSGPVFLEKWNDGLGKFSCLLEDNEWDPESKVAIQTYTKLGQELIEQINDKEKSTNLSFGLIWTAPVDKLDVYRLSQE